jgi:hypothetical protein
MHGNSHAISASVSYGCPEAASSRGQPEDRTHDLACEALWNRCMDAVADGLHAIVFCEGARDSRGWQPPRGAETRRLRGG